MATHGGPKILNNNLSFYMSSDTVKSYNGMQIQNLISNVSVSDRNQQYIKIYSSTNNINVPYIGKKYCKQVKLYNDYPNSTVCCPAPFYYGDITVSPNTIYTFSIVYKSSSDYTTANFLYKYEYSNSTYITEGGYHSNNRTMYIGNGWKWSYGQFTTRATTNRVVLHTFYYEYKKYVEFTVGDALFIQGDYILHPKYWSSISNFQLKNLTNKNTIISTNNINYNNRGEFYFNGNNSSVINIGQILNTSKTSAFTYECWYNPLTSTLKKETIIGTNQSFIQIAISNAGEYVIEQNKTNFWRLSSGIFKQLNKWTHLALTYNGTDVCFYVNGIRRVSPTSKIIESNHLQTLIGSSNISGTDVCEGQIDNIKIYNKVLTLSEIKFNFNNQRKKYTI